MEEIQFKPRAKNCAEKKLCFGEFINQQKFIK